MSLKKYITNPVVIGSILMGLVILTAFIYLLNPTEELSLASKTTKNSGDQEQAVQEQSVAYDEMMKKFSKSKSEMAKENSGEVVEEVNIDTTNNKKQSLEVVYEDDFSKDIVLPNGQVTPILKSNILGDSEEIEAKFKFEGRNEQWASNWENTLNNIVASAGSQFNPGDYNVTCKSKTCKIGVKLSEDNPYGYDEAFRAMNKEFVLNEMEVVPGPIKEDGTEYIVYYYFPDGQR